MKVVKDLLLSYEDAKDALERGWTVRCWVWGIPINDELAVHDVREVGEMDARIEDEFDVLTIQGWKRTTSVWATCQI